MDEVDGKRVISFEVTSLEHGRKLGICRVARLALIEFQLLLPIDRHTDSNLGYSIGGFGSIRSREDCFEQFFASLSGKRAMTYVLRVYHG